MEVRAIHKYARISPKKARDVAREIQGLPVSAALDTLAYTPKKAAFLIGKTLKSAVANAENNHELIADTLVIKEAHITDGPTSRRFKPRARGSAGAILKRTSHIYITLMEGEEEPAKQKATRPAKKAAPKQQPAAEETSASADDSIDLANADLGTTYESAPDEVDDLKKISGVGPALETKLNGFGVYTYQQIVDWNSENILAFDKLLSFKGRIERDEWQSQAKALQADKGGEA